MAFSAFSLLNRSWRGPALWLLAALSLTAVIVAGSDLFNANQANKTIRLLVARKDVPIDAGRAAPDEILARINESIRRDPLDEAQALANSTQARMPPAVRPLVLYNIANEHTRRAAEFVRKGDIDGAAALINLAKSEYRLALRFDPEAWDIKFNLDVAMRIVRDLPQGENPDLAPPDAPKRIWSALPGIPKGLP